MFSLYLCLTDSVFFTLTFTHALSPKRSCVYTRAHTHVKNSSTHSHSASLLVSTKSLSFFPLCVCVTGNDRLCFWLVIFCSNRCHMEVVWKKRNTIAYRQRSQSLKKTSWQLSEERATQRKERRKGKRERWGENIDAELVIGTIHFHDWKGERYLWKSWNDWMFLLTKYY